MLRVWVQQRRSISGLSEAIAGVLDEGLDDRSWDSGRSMGSEGGFFWVIGLRVCGVYWWNVYGSVNGIIYEYWQGGKIFMVIMDSVGV